MVKKRKLTPQRKQYSSLDFGYFQFFLGMLTVMIAYNIFTSTFPDFWYDSLATYSIISIFILWVYLLLWKK